MVCFRHLPAALTGAEPTVVDSYQKGLQRALEVSGAGWVSTTTLRDRTFCGRASSTTSRTMTTPTAWWTFYSGASEGVLEQLDLGAGRA